MIRNLFGNSSCSRLYSSVTNYAEKRRHFLKLERIWDSVVDMSSLSPEEKEIYNVHKSAVNDFRFSYIDPKSGEQVFTRYYHYLNGKCCGQACRHCTFDYELVPSGLRKRRQFNSSFWTNTPGSLEIEKAVILKVNKLIKTKGLKKPDNSSYVFRVVKAL